LNSTSSVNKAAGARELNIGLPNATRIIIWRAQAAAAIHPYLFRERESELIWNAAENPEHQPERQFAGIKKGEEAVGEKVRASLVDPTHRVHR